MALKANNYSNNAPRVKQPMIEADVYPGRLVQIIDLGLQAQPAFKGVEKKPAHEIMLTYELSEVFMVDEEGNEAEDKPRWVSETMPFYSLSQDNARSTKRYLVFDPNKEDDGDFSQQIGKPCNITIVNNKGSNGKIYSNIGNVAPISAKKAATLPELKNDSKVFDLDVPDLAVFQSLPQWIQERIKSNLNFKGSTLEKLLGSPKTEKKSESKPVKTEVEDTPF